MTHFIQQHTLTFTPLSPIHIGTGDSYEPTNYVIDDNTLYEFDTGGALAALTATDRDELTRTVNGKPNIRMLQAVQTFFYHRRDALKPWAVNTIPVLEGVAKLYESRVGKTANHEHGGGAVIHKLEIDRTAHNSITRQPILFGSSIKGAIRTALLNQLNHGNRSAFQGEQYRDLQQRLLQFRTGKFELDPLRLIHVGDAPRDTQDNLPHAQVFMTVNRKKAKVLDDNGNERKSQAETNQNLFKLLECVPAWRYRMFKSQLNLQQIDSTLNPHAAKLPAPSLRFTMQDIAQYCSAFYLPQLQAEIKLLQERGFIDPQWQADVEKLLHSIADKIIQGKLFLLRIGQHSGAESVTIKGVRQIKIMQGKRQPVKYANTPLTLWLAAQSKEQRSNLLPFGWVLVEIDPQQDWQDLKQTCARHNTAAAQWAAQHTQQHAELKEKKRLAQQRRAHEEQQRHLQAKQDAQAEQERLKAEQEKKQRQATMTPEQLKINALKQALTAKQQAGLTEQMGGLLYSELRELINQASSWTTTDKAELLNIANEILVFINAKGNKKAKQLLNSLQ